jgi:hypothetical protein
VCTLHLLNGNKISAIFGLFISQLHMLVGFKSLVRDATIAHKVIIPRYGEVKICCFNFLANINFKHSLWSILERLLTFLRCKSHNYNWAKYRINIIVTIFPLYFLLFWRVGCKVFIVQWIKDRKGSCTVLMLLKVWAWLTSIALIYWKQFRCWKHNNCSCGI